MLDFNDFRPDGQGDSLGASDIVTVLRTHGPLATKVVTLDPEAGEPRFSDYDNARRFSVSEHVVSNIYELADLLDRLGPDRRSFVVRGAVIDGTDRKDMLRRLIPHENPETGEIEPATLRPVPRRALLLDLDDIPCPPHLDCIHDHEAVVRYAVDLLPTPFHDVTCRWMFTSGHGIKKQEDGTKDIRLRLAYWLDRAVGGDELKAWLGAVTLGNGRRLVDCSVFGANQPNYTSYPIFHGWQDPLPRRSGLLRGSRDEVQVPEIDMSVTWRGASAGGTAPGTPGGGYEGHRARIGRDGFHDPMMAAVAAYIARHGSEVDTAWMQADISKVLRDQCRDAEHYRKHAEKLPGLIERVRRLEAHKEAGRKADAPFVEASAEQAEESVMPYDFSNDIDGAMDDDDLGDAWEPRDQDAHHPEVGDWYSRCQVTAKKTPLNNLANVNLALRMDPAWAGVLRYDQMSRVMVIAKPIPRIPEQNHKGRFTPRPWQDHDVTAVQEWLQLAGLRNVSRDTVYHAMDARAREDSYHPVQDYLNSVTWDGTARLDTWLHTYMGVENTDYSRKVGAMWLISAVARIFQPGCKADYMLILEGEQGLAKSTACKVLGGQWFSENLPADLNSKDASQHLKDKWIVELGEMKALGKNGSSTLKEFLTRRIEIYRPSYGRADVHEERQCVFVGTTNKSEYFTDETGARRYWPVKTGIIDNDALDRDRDQLFAEAVHRYRKGEHWYPDREFEAAFITPQQDARYTQDVWEESITLWLSPENAAPVERATLLEIARYALMMDVPKIGMADQARIRKILIRLKWKQGARGGRGERYWYPPPPTKGVPSSPAVPDLEGVEF